MASSLALGRRHSGQGSICTSADAEARCHHFCAGAEAFIMASSGTLILLLWALLPSGTLEGLNVVAGPDAHLLTGVPALGQEMLTIYVPPTNLTLSECTADYGGPEALLLHLNCILLTPCQSSSKCADVAGQGCNRMQEFACTSSRLWSQSLHSTRPETHLLLLCQR